jgi:hypothetical protein
MEDNPAPAAKDESAYRDLALESATSRKRGKAIVVLAWVTGAWLVTWLIFKTLLFGWIPAAIILVLVRAFSQDKGSDTRGRLRKR